MYRLIVLLASAFVMMASSSGGDEALMELGTGAGACMICSSTALRV